MAYQMLHRRGAAAWRLAAKQHGVVTRSQLLELGFSPPAIVHRLGTGRLHALWRGVYAVGRPDVDRHGRWMAAVLACGSRAVLSHRSAAALLEILSEERKVVEVSVPARLKRRQPGIVAHRRIALAWDEVRRHHGIPVTTPIDTLIDIAPGLRGAQLERAVNEADRLDLVDVEALRTALAGVAPRPGVRTLRELLDFRTFTVTESELERRFLPLARKAGLPKPRTGCIVNGFKVDFFWPELGLVVETDGLRYHRTPSQQARDHLRNQAHAAAGLIPLRFTHAQVWFEPDYVVRVLSAVAGRLRRSMAGR